MVGEMTRGADGPRLFPGATAESARQRVLDALMRADLADVAAWLEPYDSDVIRWSDWGGNDEATTRMAEVINRASPTALLSLGDPLRAPLPRWKRRFSPGLEVWDSRRALHASAFYRDVFSEVGFEDQLRLLVYDGGRFVTHVGLFRREHEPPFTRAEADRLRGLVASATTLMVAAARMSADRRPEESGDVLIRSDGAPQMVSDAGDSWAAIAGMRPALVALARRLERQSDCSIGVDVAAGALVRWARLDGSGPHYYLLQLERPERYAPPRSAALSNRQREVADLLAHGATLKDVGRMLDVSFETARGHARIAYRRLGVSNRSELVRVWTGHD